MSKNIKLRGGFRAENGQFQCERVEVIQEDKLGAFMRQDDVFRAYPVTYIGNTQEQVTRIL